VVGGLLEQWNACLQTYEDHGPVTSVITSGFRLIL
jgi:hypothetical protein